MRGARAQVRGTDDSAAGLGVPVDGGHDATPASSAGGAGCRWRRNTCTAEPTASVPIESCTGGVTYIRFAIPASHYIANMKCLTISDRKTCENALLHLSEQS